MKRALKKLYVMSWGVNVWYLGKSVKVLRAARDALLLTADALDVVQAVYQVAIEEKGVGGAEAELDRLSRMVRAKDLVSAFEVAMEDPSSQRIAEVLITKAQRVEERWS